jgi:hypothetical protein
MTAIKALARELEKAFMVVQWQGILATADEVCVVGEFEEAAFTEDTVVLDGTTAPGGAWVVLLCVSGVGFARV